MAKKILIALLKGILAGLSIGLGGFLFILMRYLIPGEGGIALGSFLFSVGLFLVCTFQFFLYTGKIGNLFEKKQDKEYYISLPIMLIGNAIGAFGLGYIFYFIFRNDSSMMETVYNVCVSRTILFDFDDYLSLMLKSFLCGTCVYLAVKAFSLNRLKLKGIFLLVFFVFVFVYAGFQHCIANMFYFGFGNHIYGETFINLGLCILFNSLGTIPGILLYRVFSKKSN